MLDKTYKVDDEGYALTLKTDANWKHANMRVLIVLEHIPTMDLKNHEILSCDDTTIPMLNIINLAKKEVAKYGKTIAPSFRVLNFRNEKHLHLSPQQQNAKESEFATRCSHLIEKMKPTHVLVCGPKAYTNLLPCDYPFNRLGWVERRKFGNHECFTTLTFDLYHLLEYKEGIYSNYLGGLVYHLSYLLNSEFPFSLQHVKPSPVYIDTREKFDSMMNVLKKSEFVGFDSETRNLTVTCNAIYTVQFSTDRNDRGYVLALDHPQTPWTSKDINYFKRELKKFFTSEEGPILITMNGMFDLRVMRRALRMPIIRRRVWEITAGEHLMNESLGEWRNLMEGTTYGNLRAILCSYQNDFYFRAKFTKEDRGTTGELKPDDPEFLKYASMDVCCLIPLKDMQIRRASFMDINGKCYAPVFKRHMLYEMSDTVHTLSHLDEFGSFIDMKYMKLLASKESPIIEQLEEIKGDIHAHPATQEANSILLKESGFKSKGLFGKKVNRWIFNLGKADHRTKLFLDVLGLSVVDTTSTGQPSINKTFIKEHKDSNDVVEMYAQYQELNKIYTTYIKGWYKILTTSQDGSADSHLRPTYGFFGVDTGRISSRNPSLQVIPQHSKSAKNLKRAFVAPPGCILVRYDYSAHEVRGWAMVSNDNTLADAFREGQKLRQEWIKNPTEEVKKMMKTRGDIHIQNAYRFFGKWVSKDDPLRQAVKSVIFGALYGKNAVTLGNDTKTAEMGELRAKLNEIYHKLLESPNDEELQHQVEVYRNKVSELKEDDRTEYAQGILDTMFKTFKNGAKWTEHMKKCAKTKGYVYSPLGRMRHLTSTIIVNPKNKKLINRQIRRGSNAPIQGFASEIAVKASRVTLEAYYKELPILMEMLGIDCKEWDLKVECSRIVHDASYYAVPYSMVLPFIQITQYMVTYGISQSLEREFGFKCNIEPEVEFETAVRDDSSEKWDWDIPNLIDNLMRNVDQGVELGIIEDGDAVKREILRPWASPKVVKYLDKKYPLLNVHLARKIYDSAKSRLHNLNKHSEH